MFYYTQNTSTAITVIQLNLMHNGTTNA